MANMSYCRFENTLHDLQDCHRNMFEPTDGMSKHERDARLAMFALVKEMAEQIDAMNSEDRHHGNAEKHEDMLNDY